MTIPASVCTYAMKVMQINKAAEGEAAAVFIPHFSLT